MMLDFCNFSRGFMKQVRNGVFETNSSSTHSISIHAGTADTYDTIVPNEKGEIYLDGGEFGWTGGRQFDAITKLNYCAVELLSHEYDWDSALKRNVKTRDGTQSEHWKTLERVVLEHTGAKKFVKNFHTEWVPFGEKEPTPNHSYIDHQSSGTAMEAFESEQTLKDFIFGPKSSLLLANDNDDYNEEDPYDI